MAARRESLAAHPLLTPPADPRYVPYTPRQRPPAKPLLRAAQNIGLDAASVGWAILDRIAHDDTDDWSEISSALARARAALLLPADATPHDITPEFVLDHLVLCDLAARDDTPVVTLSGLRGHLARDTLTFRSALHRSAKPFQALLARAVSLDALPPLPAFPPESSYPSFAVSAFTAALPLPSRATKPPLPPRPGIRGAAPASSARLAMPFASLFGQRPSTPPPPTTATPTDTELTIDVSAFVIDTAISRTDIATGIISAIKGEIAIALNDQPPWLVERVHAFSQPYLPFVMLPGKKKLQDIGGNPNRVVYAVNGALDKPEELADKFQEFYAVVEGELRRTEGPAEQTGQDEGRIRNVLETIESTLCTLLYDRLFLPSTSDDASHNEALSSRVAALNMLDLGLEHLDIDTGDADPESVDAVVQTCGQALGQLDLARSPREKAAVLVSAHKLVVEGLSKIPPIRLKARDDDGTEAPEHAGTIAIPVPTETKSPSIPSVHLSTSPDQRSAIKVPPSETAPSSTSSPVSGDVLLPILIFSVVKANPFRLVSHLLFTQRFRNQSFGGEEGYCLINLMAVAEFLENVDLGALGLGDSEKKVLSTADLTPIPISISRPSLDGKQPITGTADEQLASLRGRVGLGVDTFTGSANKVISGVVDTSFGVLRAFLPGQPVVARSGPGEQGQGEEADATTRGVRPGLGLLRRDTGFSIAGLTAALPVGTTRPRSQGHPEEFGQRELVEVSSSRPPSLRSHRSGYEVEDLDEKEDSDGGESEGEGKGEVQEDGGEAAEVEQSEVEQVAEEEVHDARSIKSFESMLSGGRTKRRIGLSSGSGSGNGTRSAPASMVRRKRLTDLTDRLAHGVAGMSKRVQVDARMTTTGQIPPPNRRFVECTEGDIRVSEVGELLREYQRLVEAVRNAGGFQE